ncbi:MAG: ABC transporter ATP-binding protein [Reyranellaceae bacterium]
MAIADQARAPRRTPEPWNDPAAVPYIRIENVVKRFGDFTAVADVSLNIYRGELFALLGGSGSGKTTLLRMLAGFETPTEGRILIDGVDMAGVAPYDRPVNMMFQSYALFPHMNVEQNIAFGLNQDGLPRAQIAERVAGILDMVQMSQFAKRKPHQLSGGQRQRVALARALVKQPKLLLLDEPLGALDKKLREQTQFELMNIQEKVGITFVMVTHDQEEAMTMASRIAVMDRGEIIQVGTPNEIYEFPNSTFVADFIGSVNMFEGRLLEDKPDHVTVESPALSCTVYVSHGVSAAPAATVWVAIRPEKVKITRTRPEGPYNFTHGKVRDIGYLGDVSTYYVTLDSGETMQATMPNLVRLAEPAVSWDEEVYLSWEPANAIVLTS